RERTGLLPIAARERLLNLRTQPGGTRLDLEGTEAHHTPALSTMPRALESVGCQRPRQCGEVRRRKMSGLAIGFAETTRVGRPRNLKARRRSRLRLLRVPSG